MATGIIEKSTVASEFNTNVTNKITYTYHSGNPPVRPGNAGGTTPDIFSNGLASMNAGDIGGSIITAADLVEDIRLFIYNNFSSIRNISVVHRYTGNSSAIISETTARAFLNDDYKVTIPTINLGISAGTVITTPTWSNAYSVWKSATDAVAYTITYTTHTSHSSHGSRFRR